MDHDSLNSHVVRGLRMAGVDILTSLEAANERLPDDLQLEFATASQRVIYTANVADFARLHHKWMVEGRKHTGIVVRSRQQMSIGNQVRGLSKFCESCEPAAAANLFAYLDDFL